MYYTILKYMYKSPLHSGTYIEYINSEQYYPHIAMSIKHNGYLLRLRFHMSNTAGVPFTIINCSTHTVRSFSWDRGINVVDFFDKHVTSLV